MKYTFYIALAAFSLLLVSCKGKPEQRPEAAVLAADSIYYAGGFTLETHPGYELVTVKNPWDKSKVLHRYLLVPKSGTLPENLPAGTLLRTPLERIVVFSSVLCGMLDELGALSSLAGVTDPQYMDIPAVQAQLSLGKILDLGQEMNPDIEKLMLAEPEAIFTNPVNEAGTGSLNKLNVPVVHCVEYMETHPLGQTEWIRLIGRLFDKKEHADALFFETVRSYNELKALTATVSHRPTVFTELKSGDFWYMPGGKSYMAQLLAAAGADYILKDDPSAGSISLPFEQVLDKAENACFWLFKYYQPQDMTYAQLAEGYNNYTLFDAFKKRNIYVCNTAKIPYYRELPLHPDRILMDMIHLFHPELLPGYRPRYFSGLK
ncbi:MAG: ABC transporter substrate-binding protein [Dysgonamonadaceae bacterium]|jgi:iron complex transport system substrate-binding protein|nr:ABC transporter substrate-binding protein [Dysgonamonadaceae bacterium]